MGRAMPHADAAPPDLLAWRTDALEAALAALRPGLRIEVLASTGSTNTQLLERARAGDTRPVLLVAERQTAGRGRLGRRWCTDSGRALTFSLGLALAPRAWSGLSLAVGVAIAEALDPLDPLDAGAPPRVRLKWPNDLWLDSGSDRGPARERKFGGVLIETATAADPGARHAVIGIGLNLDAPAGIEPPAAGWREAQPRCDAPSLLACVAPALLAALEAFEREGFAAFAARYAQRDALAGRAVGASTVPPCHGQADGVDADGALRLVTPNGVLRIDSADVSIRPTPC